ncbi:MAG: hypothetical protein Q7R47_05090, partial [Candidatus Diapherotrites archaeon]|nr:hypothetical protein [Candidatus Diapherotrites archaeon]
RTNDGNVLKDRALSVVECTAFWEGFSGQKVRIDWPDATLSQSRVVFESHLVSVQAKDFESLGPSTFVVLTHAFPNAQQLLDAVNSIAGKVR